MKSALTLLLAASALLSSCVQPPPYAYYGQNPHGVVVHPKPYLALPGQGLIVIPPPQAPPTQIQTISPTYAGSSQQMATEELEETNIRENVLNPETQAQPEVAAQQIPTQPIAQPTQTSTELVDQPFRDQNRGAMSYKIRITNGTPYRLFIEAQDAADHAIPAGFMLKGKTSTATRSNAAPITGPILVVVRDPDQPGSPELRRYRIPTPKISYNNGSIEITIKQGCYSASVNGQVYAETQPEN